MNTVKLMKIPAENIFAKQNIKAECVQEIFSHVTNLMRARTKSLTEYTGIFSTGWYISGFLWDRIRKHAMK